MENTVTGGTCPSAAPPDRGSADVTAVVDDFAGHFARARGMALIGPCPAGGGASGQVIGGEAAQQRDQGEPTVASALQAEASGHS
ncbi:hypothetical protein GCM10023335_68820 [Streptomyces siamensis]|uniref:Uncharacterized protein n=1 Tax=Streptomyces siamensis TaxID=1274986 RepID=A0ABP9JG73_9ACTN